MPQNYFILPVKVASDGLGAMLEHNVQLAVAVLTGEEKTTANPEIWDFKKKLFEQQISNWALMPVYFVFLLALTAFIV